MKTGITLMILGIIGFLATMATALGLFESPSPSFSIGDCVDQSRWVTEDGQFFGDQFYKVARLTSGDNMIVNVYRFTELGDVQAAFMGSKYQSVLMGFEVKSNSQVSKLASCPTAPVTE